MKKTIFIVLMLTGLFQQQHAFAQTGSAERRNTIQGSFEKNILNHKSL